MCLIVLVVTFILSSFQNDSCNCYRKSFSQFDILSGNLTAYSQNMKTLCITKVFPVGWPQKSLLCRVLLNYKQARSHLGLQNIVSVVECLQRDDKVLPNVDTLPINWGL